MYLTATFPYLVTTVFLIRSAMLDGALEGLKYMLTPDVSNLVNINIPNAILISKIMIFTVRYNALQLNRLKDPNVWLDAATQIFYSMGIGFGGQCY